MATKLSPDEAASPFRLPIIDFANWDNGGFKERTEIGAALADACRTVGFAYIINHGISPALVEEAFGWSKRLFDLKLEDKMLAPHPPGPTVHRGYSYPGLEKVSQVISDDLEVGRKLREVKDCKESYEIGSEENTEQPNVWLPENVLPGYRKFMTEFYWLFSQISQKILTAIGTGLQLRHPEYLLKFHSGHNNQLRLLHYPPVPAAELEKQISARMPAHSDWCSITILFQDECGGLEVEHPHVPGEFIEAIPLENAMVMNVGDLLMRWSNDYLKSTLHRVTLPSKQDRIIGEERLTQARYSIPYFVAPDSTSVIECLAECASDDNPPKYEPVVQREYDLMRGKLQY
ncbi:hypothetical protein B0O99DRAFT_632805 [Bisporella sp. PMI_857]|nr:hypothetical protein B0O99DRAFT_632805 [Bisporella sp. PMI_857]